jgi:hypothetical protein
MNNSNNLSLGFAWWNTSLSPLLVSQANEKKKEIASGIVNFLINSIDIDCLALGEVTVSDLDYIKYHCLPDYEIFNGTLKSGRLRFDTGLIFNSQRLEKVDSKCIISAYGTQKLKIANRIDFKICETGEYLHIFVLHWPSRARLTENSPKRNEYGSKLRSTLDELKSTYSYSPQIIVIGDFNDEPFNNSLVNVFASRDRTLVSNTRNTYLYNPFWRHLGEEAPFIQGTRPNNVCGTYYNRRGEETKWRTFDQILVSSSFITEGKWFINEELTTIFENQYLYDLITKKSKYFDHFPIVTVVQRSKN